VNREEFGEQKDLCRVPCPVCPSHSQSGLVPKGQYIFLDRNHAFQSSDISDNINLFFEFALPTWQIPLRSSRHWWLQILWRDWRIQKRITSTGKSGRL
jgi:hypothetical protein